MDYYLDMHGKHKGTTHVHVNCIAKLFELPICQNHDSYTYWHMEDIGYMYHKSRKWPEMRGPRLLLFWYILEENEQYWMRVSSELLSS